MPISILVIGADQQLVERFRSDFGFYDGRADTYGDLHSAVEALNGPAHYDLILTSHAEPVTDELELLRQVRALDHRKDTPVVMLAERARG